MTETESIEVNSRASSPKYAKVELDTILLDEFAWNKGQIDQL